MTGPVSQTASIGGSSEDVLIDQVDEITVAKATVGCGEFGRTGKGIGEEITLLEKKQLELEKTLEEPDFFKDSERSVPLVKAYQEVKEELEHMLKEWEKAQIHLEATKKELGIN